MAAQSVQSRITAAIKEFLGVYSGELTDLNMKAINQGIAPKFDNWDNFRRIHKAFIKEEASRLVRAAAKEQQQQQPSTASTPSQEGGAGVGSSTSSAEGAQGAATALAAVTQGDDAQPTASVQSDPKSTPAPTNLASDEKVAQEATESAKTNQDFQTEPAEQISVPDRNPQGVASGATPLQQAGQKRRREIPQSIAEVCAWLTDVLETGGFDALSAEARLTFIDNVRKEAIDGETILDLKDEDLKSLDLRLMGPRRKLLARIKDTFAAPQQTPLQTPVDARTALQHAQPANHTTPRLNLENTFPQNETTQREQAAASTSPTSPPASQQSEAGAPGPSAPSPQQAEQAKQAQEPAAQSPVAQDGTGGPEPMEIDPQMEAQENEAAASIQDAAGAASEGVAVEYDAEEAERDVLLCSEKVKEQMLTEEFCVNACQWAVKKSMAVFSELHHSRWASVVVKQAKIKELQDLSARMKLPASSFVTFGDTGAGKSTLLNALIGESNILPTNGMRACTATIIELSFNKEATGPTYVGEAEFVTREEWAKELATLVDDLTQQDGRCIIMEPDSKAPNYQAFCKLNAIYGIDYRKSYTTEVLANGQRVRKNLMAAQLKDKLMRHPVSRYLGTTQREQSDDPARFRRQLEKYMETPNSIEGSQLWPLVKRVRIRGRNWKVLESGAILVDAPGVNDDNSARDKVVKEYLKNADGVWIIANMKRACNNKTAKDMLGQSFRRQLLMDGQYGSLAFIATQSDEFQRSDVIRSLGLRPDASVEQCAMARKQWVRTRVEDDFYDGLEVNPDEVRSKYRLPVFCVSSVDFQILSGVRNKDGEARAFKHLAGTEIPKLQQFVHETTLKRRYTNVRRQAEQLVQFYEGIEAMLGEKADAKDDPGMRQQRQRAVTMAAASLQREADIHLTQFDKYLHTAFSKELAPLLKQGAKHAEGDCIGAAEGWRCMHWCTYKATVRRHGVFRANWNEELAEAVFRSASMEWERALVSTLGKKLEEVREKCLDSVKKAHTAIGHALNVDSARISSIRAPQEHAASLYLSGVQDQVMSLSQSQQRELSRSVAPHIQEVMSPGYDAGMGESGPGSHQRRKDLIEGHLKQERGRMFNDATANICKNLDALRKQIKQALNASVNQLAQHLTITYSSFWDHDNSPDAKRSRAALLSALQSPMFEAQSNLKKLLKAHGAWSAEEDEVDGVEAVNEASAKVVIDLTSDSEEPPVSQAVPAMPPPIRVKLEGGQKRDPVIVVVMGATGAGKSTLINAVLGEVDLLPTNSMRACTATIIEILQKAGGGKKYSAQVEFQSKAEWEAQVSWLLNRIQADGPNGTTFEVPEEDTPAHEVYCKVRAAYGTGVNLASTASEVLSASQGGAVAKALGTSVSVEADTASELLKLYNPYVDSTNETGKESLWPIVKTVRLQGPFEVLQGGITLVDSPGLGDDDSARNAAVKHYLARADSVWLAGNIKRAVNEKTIKDLLTVQLRKQVVRTGRTGSLCVIATQSDDAVASELQSNLQLSENATKLETILARNKFVKERLEKDFYAGTGKLPKKPSSRKPNRFQLRTFTASSTEFQKLLKVRTADGAAETFKDIAETEIPALRDQLRATASLAVSQSPKLGRLLLECKEKADAAARGGGEEMDEDDNAMDSGSDTDMPAPAPAPAPAPGVSSQPTTGAARQSAAVQQLLAPSTPADQRFVVGVNNRILTVKEQLRDIPLASQQWKKLHALIQEKWTAEQIMRVFGPCGLNANWVAQYMWSPGQSHAPQNSFQKRVLQTLQSCYETWKVQDFLNRPARTVGHAAAKFDKAYTFVKKAQLRMRSKPKALSQLFQLLTARNASSARPLIAALLSDRDLVAELGSALPQYR